ncbi:hypothetical protein [Roseateles toxinivorans]|uniref:Uncharacterized protein n=1 Tax=Roseateles toxinivorans TaxID=270368 RepID=A0A4R6QND5_9BURK|nr:hypothetical protein [Roseateles toxinivorans]TDP71422.1 hypothetical protein DES47_103403 [Roseateles toxinivorans]
MTLVRRFPLFQKLKIDRRLTWLLLVGLLAVAGELSLRAWESHQELSKELKSVRARAQLMRQSADQVDWAQQTQIMQTMRADLESKLWHSPSEAQAQARLRDWLAATLRAAGLTRFTINLLPPQPPAAPAVTQGDAPPSASLRESMQQRALRLRASLSFELAPSTLETVLFGLEHGGELANVDSITVSRRSRRVELSVSMPVLVEPALATNNSTPPARSLAP